MASPEVPYQTYRISGVPRGVSLHDIKQWFPEAERKTILHISCAPPTQTRDNSADVLTITFSQKPDSLASLLLTSNSTPLGKFLPNLDPPLSALPVDAHFLGLTPFNDVTDEANTVDIIAVTGLAGRPFGSWQCNDGSMWLRDHLPVDVPNARVSIYGYASKVVKFDSHAILRNFSDDFLGRLESSRPLSSPERRRPLILVGHSLGGMIIKDAWVRCAEEGASNPFYKDLRRAMYGFVLFGTPHNGMEADEMIAAAEGQPTESLPRDLKPGSSTVKLLRERFAKASQELRVVSCYELRETPTLKKEDNGSYSRTGEKKLMVPEPSACLFWPDEIETRIPIDENHSMIAKLSSRAESKYHEIKNCIADFAADAVERISNRFLRSDICDAMEKICALLQFILKRATNLVRQERENLSDIFVHTDAFRSTLSDPVLGQAFLGAHLGRGFVSRFARKSGELEDILSPFEVVALDTDVEYQSFASSRGSLPAACNRGANQVTKMGVAALFSNSYIKGFLQGARAVIQAQVQMLSLSMLRQQVDRDFLEPHSFTKEMGLYRIAAMQALFNSTDNGPQEPLQGSLSIVSSGELLTGRYTDDNGESERLVLVEYKPYALPSDHRRQHTSEDDEQQAEATKYLAQKLATLLSKSSGEQMNPERGRHVFDATTYTFQCIGYMDEPSNGTLAFLYEIPESGVGPEGKLGSNVKTLKQMIQDGLKMPLEEKFQLAFRICSTVLNLHCSASQIEIPARSSSGVIEKYDVYLKGFEFSRKAVGKSNPFESSDKDNIYRHPDRQGLPGQHFTKEHDLYAVGLVLLEVGTSKSLERWSKPLKERLDKTAQRATPQAYKAGFTQIAKDNLRNTMGSRYAEAVVKCLDGAVRGFSVDMDDKQETALTLAFQEQVVEEVTPGISL